MRRAANTDANAPLLDAYARELGFSIVFLDGVGSGVPDRLFGFNGADRLVEYKDPSSRYGRAGLTEDQRRFVKEWRGTEPLVVESTEDLDELQEWFQS